MAINTDELTLGQIKELSGLCGNTTGGTAPRHPYLGKVVLVRTRVAGVHVGELVSFDDNGVRLKDACRLWRWRGAKTLSEVANNGVNNEAAHTRIAEVVPDMILTEHKDCELIPCSDIAAKDLRTPRWP